MRRDDLWPRSLSPSASRSSGSLGRTLRWALGLLLGKRVQGVGNLWLQNVLDLGVGQDFYELSELRHIQSSVIFFFLVIKLLLLLLELLPPVTTTTSSRSGLQEGTLPLGLGFLISVLAAGDVDRHVTLGSVSVEHQTLPASSLAGSNAVQANVIQSAGRGVRKGRVDTELSPGTLEAIGELLGRPLSGGLVATAPVVLPLVVGLVLPLVDT